MQEKLDQIKQRFDEVNDLIIQPDIISDQKRYVKLNKEFKDLKKIVDARAQYMELTERLKEAKDLIINHFCEHVEDHLEIEKMDSKRHDIKYLSKAYVISIMEGLFFILNNKDEEMIIKENMKKFIILSITQFLELITIMR